MASIQNIVQYLNYGQNAVNYSSGHFFSQNTMKAFKTIVYDDPCFLVDGNYYLMISNRTSGQPRRYNIVEVKKDRSAGYVRHEDYSTYTFWNKKDCEKKFIEIVREKIAEYENRERV